METLVNLLAAILAVTFLQFFEDRNLVASYVYAPPANGTGVTPETPDLVVDDPCPGCAGKGKLLLTEPDFGQSKGRLEKGRKTRKQCPLCQGKGRIRAFTDPSELSAQVARDRAAFSAKHQKRGEIAVGEAFVPNAVYEGLSREKRKLVDNAYGHPCRKCTWTGIETCRKCKGSGVLECPNRDCKGGWQVTRPELSVSICHVCGGARFIVCPECGGRRAHTCSKCGGTGLKKKGHL